VTPAVMVALTSQGLILPEANGRPSRALDVSELLLLEEFVRTRGRPATAANGGSETADFIEDLRARHLWLSASDPQLEEAIAPRNGGPDEADFRAADRLVAAVPLIFRAGPAGFESLEHDGRARIRLSAVEIAAASEFRIPITPRDALVAHEEKAGRWSLDEGSHSALLSRLARVGLVERLDPNHKLQQRALAPEDREMRKALSLQHQLHTTIERHMAEHDTAERQREARGGAVRVPVIPVHFQWQLPPLALGMIIAFAKEHDGGRLSEHYDFRLDWTGENSKIRGVEQKPSIFLFSHYIWSSTQNLAFSAQVKASNSHHITIHGGPDVPKYEGDQRAYFAAHPHVDVAVRGEGEVTTAEALDALRQAWHGGPPDLSVLEDVPGLSYRIGDLIVRTAERQRLTDLNVVPSPYLTGLFDAYLGTSIQTAVVESNRGCPYGCTFCDWGSATAQRIRQFDLDRVFAELEWCAANGVEVIGMADANFGILERDVTITEKVRELKERYGSPRHFGLNYAKNSLKHLKPIVKILVSSDILTYGQISLQSMDKDTLSTINRSNIKLEKYDELAQEFREAGLPLFVDLMMGLPGATMDSFRNDLQGSIDREVIAKVFPTQLLVNSPMNEPSYRLEHGIEAAPGELVTSAASFTRSDYEAMRELRRVFLLLWKFGILRHVASYVRQEAGLREVDFFETLWRQARSERERWPMITFTLEAVPSLMVPPVRWRLFLDEVRRYLVEALAIADDSALDAVLDVQNALLPARNRSFPESVPLAHDYMAWHAALIAAKDARHHNDWPAIVPPLRSFPPATLTVKDPYDVCALGMGQNIDSSVWNVWELDSPVSRPVRPLHAAID
jgi:hypothetical protein